MDKTQLLHKVYCTVFRDGATSFKGVDGETYFTYESVRECYDRERMGVIYFEHDKMPQEFLKGEVVRFHIPNIDFYVKAQLRGDYTHFDIFTSSKFLTPTTVITHLGSCSELPHSLVQVIHDRYPAHSDISIFHIGYVY